MNILPEDMTVNTVLKRLADNDVNGITFITSADRQEFISYADFIESIEFCLYNLLEQGIVAGDELLIQVEDQQSFLTVFWSAMMGGIIAVPLAVGNQAEQQKKVLQVWRQLSRPWVVADAQGAKNLQKLDDQGRSVANCMAQRSVDIGSLMLRRKRHTGVPAARPGDLAYVQYSSGSTGVPKGVLLTHSNLCANVSAILKRSGTTPTDSMLSWMPLSHDMGMICFHMCGIFSGVDQFIMPTGLFIRRPLLWMQVVSEKKVTQLYSPNFGQQFFLMALKKNTAVDWDLSSVRILFNGAEQISPWVCREFLETLAPFGLKGNIMYPAYGLAEASVAVSLPDPSDELRTYAAERSSLRPGHPVLFSDDGNTATHFVEVGYAIPDCAVRITHAGNVLPEKWLGSIEIKGRNVTQGYYGFPEDADELFTPDGWLRTGDLGFLANGRLVFTGRTKNVIIINSQNYFPHDLENLLLSIPGIELGKLVITSCWNEGSQKEELLVFVNYKEDDENFLSLKQEISRKLITAVGLLVEKVIPVRKIPKTTSGKIQQYLLTDAYLAGEYDEVLERLTNPANTHKLITK